MRNFELHIESIPGRFIAFEGKNYRWIGGTNYLGIGNHPLFQEKLFKGLQLFSQNWGSSRINNLKISIWEELEYKLAKRFNRPAAALTSSGMLAGQTALQIVSQKYPKADINLAPFTHPAFWRSPNKPFSNGDFKDWEKTIIDGQIIAMDGVGSPWVSKNSFNFVKVLSAKSTLIIDESHRLAIADIALETQADLIQTSSLSKAFGIPAGVILGSKTQIEDIKSDPFWVGSSPPNPAFIFACLHSQEAYDERIHYLKELNELFDSTINTTKLTRFEGYPAFCSDDPNVFLVLKNKGFLANQFSYPDIFAPPICRASLNANLTKEDVIELSTIFYP